MKKRTTMLLLAIAAAILILGSVLETSSEMISYVLYSASFLIMMFIAYHAVFKRNAGFYE